MAVLRIQNLDINSRGLFTGIYGYSANNEYYIDKNLCKYHLWQELYYYLHEMGFITIFYNRKDNFFSYQLRDMEFFFRKIHDAHDERRNADRNVEGDGGRRRHSRCSGPLGQVRLRAENQDDARPGVAAQPAQPVDVERPSQDNSSPSNNLSSGYPDIIVGGNLETGLFYCSKSNENNSRIFDRIFKYVDDNRQNKLVVVFTNPETTSVNDPDYEITGLQERLGGHAKTDMPLRLLVLYPAETSAALSQSFDRFSDKFFFNQYFKNRIFPDPQSNAGSVGAVSVSSLFYVSRPGVDEIANVLNRRRILEGMRGMFNKPWDSECRNLWQDFPMRDGSGKIIMGRDNKPRQVQSVKEMMELPVGTFELSLEKLEDEGGRKKFDQLLGIDDLRNKLDAYIKAFHDYRNGRIKEFIPHIALTGNPGTGKTTVARLIGQILREEGLLESGHMVETNPGGLIGQFVGETPVKTNEVCQQARGGILFIDEAYGLCREEDSHGGGNASFGKQAVDALLTFMLPAGGVDSAVVFAGYPDEIDYLLNNGNPGLARRVPYIWNIADYSPDVLYEIGMNGLGGRETTEDFRIALKMIFAYKYGMRNKNWGNAGDANKIVQTIVANYLEQGKEGALDVDCIPADLMRCVKDISQEEINEIMHDLDQLVGLHKVKSGLRDLVAKLKVQRYEMREAGIASPSLENLNFVFSGNPGTGKTTVAKMLGKILYGFGVLDYPDVIEVNAQKISSGDSARNLKDSIEKAVGKVLFIDEAYSLVNQGSIGAIDTLTQALTDDRYKGKMAVVLAGYSSDMVRLLEANRGLHSRFTNQIHFEDYTDEELWQVLKLKAAWRKPISLTIDEGCHPYAVDYFSRIAREKFSNAREAENLLKKLVAKRGSRVTQNRISKDDENFAVILPQDFESYGRIDPSLVKVDDGASKSSPMEKLNGLQGIDDLRSQFAKYLEQFRYAKMHPQEVRFRPHMAFLGNPGTGKTTIARIFGSILREEHLLDNDTFIEAKAEDFIAGYEGGTQEKSQAKCKEARGGIMFIDEAHHLYQGEDDHGRYAKEALRVILTELESRTDTLYIFAGYTREMNEFLDKADSGLRSRVQNNIFYFPDYKPEVLTTIVRSHFNTINTTPEFDKMLGYAIGNVYNRRNPYTFGNARAMEIIAGNILSRYRDLHSDGGVLDVDCIPEEYLGCLKPVTPERELEISKELKDMIGLDNVKELLDRIKGAARGRQKKVSKGLSKSVKPDNLTFLFKGNPGTGKTTVASILGKILFGYGLLDSDEVKVYSKNDILDKYVGGTQKNVTRMFNECFGRVMFIDEAYMLARDEHGKDALDQITANMTDRNYIGKMAIVMAGYTKDINEMLNSNSGLSSRFQYHVIFDDYTNDQMWQILENNVIKNGMSIDKDVCKRYADAFFDLERRKGPNFGNARVCVSLFEELERNQNNRIGEEEGELTDEELRTILPEDFPNYVEVSLNNAVDKSTSSEKIVENDHCDSGQFQYTLDCSKNDSSKLVQGPEDLEYAVGLLHSDNGEGTGFVVSMTQKRILTCSHVIEGGDSFEFRMLSGAFTTQARVLWSNYEQDMALLEVDELPEKARFFDLDSEINENPKKLIRLILCGYPDGSAFASGVSLVEGSLTNFEKNRQWNDRCFDTVYANMSATHGCSGGPVVRSSDLKVIGLLQGGKDGGEIQLITDIHQLFRNIKIIM